MLRKFIRAVKDLYLSWFGSSSPTRGSGQTQTVQAGPPASSKSTSTVQENVKHSLLEQVYLERSFKYFMIVFTRLVLKPADLPQTFKWPAMQVNGCTEKFVQRNIAYARPANDPVYRQQPKQ